MNDFLTNGRVCVARLGLAIAIVVSIATDFFLVCSIWLSCHCLYLDTKKDFHYRLILTTRQMSQKKDHCFHVILKKCYSMEAYCLDVASCCYFVLSSGVFPFLPCCCRYGRRCQTHCRSQPPCCCCRLFFFVFSVVVVNHFFFTTDIIRNILMQCSIGVTTTLFVTYRIIPIDFIE